MSGYRVVAHRSGRVIRERFYVTIVAANGETLFTSEQYRDRDHAVELGQTFAAMLEGTFVDTT